MTNFFMEQFMKIYQNFFFHLKTKIEKNDNYLDKRIKIFKRKFLLFMYSKEVTDWHCKAIY